MNNYYKDILSRISEEPKWWDENAVPRFEDFTPDQVANIYADQIVLMLITCQECGTEYKVAMSQSQMSRFLGADKDGKVIMLPTLDVLAKSQQLHYGDPPHTNCCVAGSSMNSEPRKVLEFWQRTKDHFGWERLPELEIDIEPEWVKD